MPALGWNTWLVERSHAGTPSSWRESSLQLFAALSSLMALHTVLVSDNPHTALHF